MNTVITGYTIVLSEENQPGAVLPGIPDENAEALTDKDCIPAKRFGIADIWKIHSGKRYANVYPYRI